MTTARRVTTLVAVGSALQLGFILGWVELGKGVAESWVKWGIVCLCLVAVFVLLYVTMRSFLWPLILWCCGLLAISGIGIYQLLGFTMFPGLVKDVELFSWDYLLRTLAMFCLIFLGYLGLTVMSRMLYRIFHL
jgi:hypothetical protein